MRRGLFVAGAGAFALVAVLAAGAGTAAPGNRAAHTFTRPAERPHAGALARDRVPGEVIVRFRDGTSTAEQARTVRAEGARIARKLRLGHTKLVEVTGGRSVDDAIAALEDDPDVLFAEPNYIRHAAAVPNDTRFAELWALDQPSDADIDAPEAWATTTGSASVVVAVIDTGVAYDHPDLAPNMWTNPLDPTFNGVDDDLNGKTDDVHGWDFIQNDRTPLDFNGHGSHVAGTIGAQGNNGLGVTGVNWDVSLMALRAADAYGSFPLAATADAMTYACAHGARVVNGSFGGSDSSLTEQAVIASSACANTLFVFAAGNDGKNNDTTPFYPCGYTSARVLCVAATNKNDGLASYSNRGATSVDLAAPGGGGGPVFGEILSTVPSYTQIGQIEGFEDDVANPWPRWGNPLGSGVAWGRSGLATAGSWSLADSPAGNYVPSSTSSIRNLAPYDFSGKAGCLFVYDLRLDTEEDKDFLVITAGATTAAGTYGIWAPSGNSFGYDTYVDDLSMLDGSPTAYLRFALVSNANATVGDGANVDEVQVGCLTPGGGNYAEFIGTSMASPHVAGVAALVLAAHPSWTTAQVRTAILSTVDPLTVLGGKVATGGRVNAAAAVASGSEPAPPPPPPPPPDTKAPKTKITSGPTGRTRRHRATFRFVSTEAHSHFRCRLDKKPWKTCKSPKRYSKLRKGRHTFRVRAIDAAGNADPTPAVRAWRIA